MRDKTLMRLMVDVPFFIREKLLTDSEIMIFNLVKDTGLIGMSSYSLSRDAGISVQSASSRLKNLYRKKYLNRTEIVSDSGGIEYVYKSEI